MDPKKNPVGIATKLSFFITVCVQLLTVAPVSEARVTRGCSVNVTFRAQQMEVDGEWIDLDWGTWFDAGRMVFRASAPSGQPNRARMRASKKAERCVDNWWDSRECNPESSRAWGTSGYPYLEMEESICRDIADQGRLDLYFKPLRGSLHYAINGDRCCYHSDRGCPYDYAQCRAGMFCPYGIGGGGPELWPGHEYTFECYFSIIYELFAD